MCLLSFEYKVHTKTSKVIYMQGGSGSASNIRFQNIEMHNVTNPILIDQYYCDRKKPCKEQVIYRNTTRPNQLLSLNFLIENDVSIGSILITEISSWSKECGVQKHQRNKCFRYCYKIQLQQELPLSGDYIARY